jgi:hypothetical protein
MDYIKEGVVWGRGVLRIVYFALSIVQRRGGRVGGTACVWVRSCRARDLWMLSASDRAWTAAALVSKSGIYA